MQAKEIPMPSTHDPAGQAALSICEALLLALKDRGLLPEHEIAGLLRDAAATHENAAGTGREEAHHRTVAALIHAIIAREHAPRHP